MNNLFDPRTFSTDWEVMVFDKLERSADGIKLRAFAGTLHDELDLPINTDWNTIEFALGINRSLDQIWKRIESVTDRVAQMLHEWDWEFLPAGAHPTHPMFNSSHIHVGTIRDEAAAIQLENRMIRYVPAFAALAANSPLAQRRPLTYKSWRVRLQAHGCTSPPSLRDPNSTQATWGTDAGPKLYGAPTFEVRITDCASSRRLLAEMATFVAAFVQTEGGKPIGEMPSDSQYIDYLTNRWSAAKYGLQATFLWDGKSVPVVDLLSEMLDNAADALTVLGAKRSDLAVIENMLAKRICQADYVLSWAKGYDDSTMQGALYGKLMRHWDIFDNYVADAKALEPAKAPDNEAILQNHLAMIGDGTHFYRSREAMSYPPPAADSIIEQLIERKQVAREITEKRGVTLSRIG